MRSLKFAIALVVGSFVTPTLAQQTLDWPVGELQDYHLDSGVQSNPANRAQTVFLDVVTIQDAVWLRVYFADVHLEAGSFIRITSLLDQEVQELDANGLAMWDNSSAYFNGNALLVELVAAPRTTKNRFVIDQVAVETAVAHPLGTCGICGADDRVPSDEDWSARLFPAGCSASVWNTESCLVSAGHCMGGNMVIQFRVPNSNGNCSTNNPPIAEQFPITSFMSVNGGVGNDWAVMTSGTNNLGQTPFDRYGEFRPIASSPPAVGNALGIWGFGIDNQCTRSQTQQTSDGAVTSVFSTSIRHNVDATFGNSGSGIIRNGEILAIVTHCPCPNAATRVDHPDFVAARELCGQPCADPGDTEGVPVPAGEDFDSYADGFLLDGVNGWSGWDDSPAAVARVTNDQARSLPHSIEINAGDDAVQQYLGAFCEGQYVYTAYQYIPTAMNGLSYFIMLNNYDNTGGPKNWSVQVNFDNSTGLVHDDGSGAELPIINNAWVEIRLEIDLDTDVQKFFYGGTLLYTGIWSDHISGGGQRVIDTVDLFANGATPVYYDDISLVAGGKPCPWDLDGNGTVGATDLLSLLVTWGPCDDCKDCPADFDGNCTVGATDLLALLANWGPCP